MMAARKYKDPFGRLFYNAQRSATNGPKGSGQKILDPDYIPRKIDFTIEDLKDIWYNQQGGKCYWLGITLKPEWTNVSWHPLALSIDRLECGGDYIKDNIVICSRMANTGRSKYDKDKFRDVIDYIKTSMGSGNE
tara:strand:+ start:219 stop:623 length:405 start_codon:yes stop_codon:yes gene_type:complete